jgi:hypothetical protein
MSSKIADAISHGKESFEKNGFVVVTNEKKETIGQITLVTSIPENSPSESK